jgi:hypothetical protein
VQQLELAARQDYVERNFAGGCDRALQRSTGVGLEISKVSPELRNRNRVRVILLGASLGGVSFLLFCALLFSNYIGYGYHPKYPFALPFHFHAALILLVSASGLLLRQYRPALCTASMLLLGTLVLSAGYAMYWWPGGDDGGGMLWFALVLGGAFCALCTAIAAPFVLRSSPEN